VALEFDFKELQIRNIGSWPLFLQKIVLGICSLIVFSSGYWFDLNQMFEDLKASNQKVFELSGRYIDTHRQVSNIASYREEINKIKDKLHNLTALLPLHSEASGLLGEISQRATYSGVQFVAIKPGEEQDLDFYKESLTQFTVSGSYNSLGGFVSSIAAMPRLVTLHDFSIKAGTKNASLIMDLVAKSYWLNASEKNK